MTARNRELLALVPASLLLTAGFAAIFIQESEVLSDVSLTYGGIFLGLCLAGHLVIRFTLPHADPYLFPLVAVLACFGLVVIYRIDDTLAREQAQWFVVGLALFAATIMLLRDFRVLERYRYTIAAGGLLLLLLPRVPGIGEQVNGAYLGVAIGPISFQPAEFGKIAIIIFLAAYLKDTRQMLVQGSRRVLGVTFPPLKHLGPLLVVWGAAMFMLVFIRDLGSSLMYFGGFLALIYVATNRLSFVVIGLAMFSLGAWFFARTVGHVQLRVDTWLHPFEPGLIDKVGGSYQIAQSLFAQADGGLFGTGLGGSLLNGPTGATLIPAPQTDLIYAVITNELGLVGACGLLGVYLLVIQRGFKIAALAGDSLLQAAGHRADRGVRPAGVRDRRRRDQGDPAHRRDAAVRLLRRLLDPGQLRPAGAAAARLRSRAGRRAGAVNRSITRLFGVLLVLFGVLVGFTSWWTVFGAEKLRDNPENRRILLAEELIKRGVIRADDGAVLAGSRPLSQKRFGRRYPTGALFAHAVGCTSLDRGRSGLEDFYNDALTGRRTELIGAIDSLLGPQKVGDDLRTRLDPKAQEVATKALAGRPQKGAAVAIELKTGAVRVLAAKPSFDPNTVRLRRQPQPRHAGPLPARLDDEDRHRRRGAGHRALRARLAGQRQEPARSSPARR